LTTEAQIKANQENAKKSTGPNTPEGKKRSSMNAMTHGVFAQIPILPGEDVEALTSLADAINSTYKPKDAMELMLVERIIMATFRQIRLREAEAANIKINMIEERITESLNVSMQVPFLDRFTSHDLTPEKETYYQYLLEVSKELKDQGDASIDYSIDTIQNNMSYTFELLKQKPTEYKTTWEIFIKNPEMIKIAMQEIKDRVNNYLEKNKFAHTAFYLLEEIKTMHRLPNSRDMALFNRYQTQFDNELYRAMNALQKLRESRGKLMKSQMTIEGDISEYAAV
jgi:hypothetical protein